MLNNKAGPLSFSPPKVNVLFPLQHHMVTWRWIRLMIVFESSRKQNNQQGASCSNIGRIRTKENIAVDTHFDRHSQHHWGLYDRIQILA